MIMHEDRSNPIYKGIETGAPDLTVSVSDGDSNLTRSQYLLWLGQQLHRDEPLYNMIVTFDIRGRIDLVAFRQAFQTLLLRSDALRTIITMRGSVPIQQPLENMTHEVELVDLSQEREPFSAYRTWLVQRKTTLLKLDERLFDTALVRLGPDRHVWYLCQHHLITDGVTFELMQRHMSTFYELAVQDRLDEAPILPAYADYVAYERSFRQTEPYQKAVAFWEEKLELAVPPLTFYGNSLDRRSSQTERILCDLGPDRSIRLRDLARDRVGSLSMDMSMSAVFAALVFATLHRITGESVLRLGTPFHARPTAAFKNTIGVFLEIGILQVALERDETFVSLGQKVLGEIFAGIGQARPGVSSAATNRAYEVLLNYVNAEFGQFAGFPIAAEWIHSGYGDNNHAVRIQITSFDESSNFQLAFDLNTAVFGEREREWLTRHFLTVVDAFLADPDQSLGDFNLLTEHETQRLLIDFNDTSAPLPSQNVVQLFEAQAAQTPQGVAIVDRGTEVTYSELNRRANQLAHYLHAQGVGPDISVAICFERSIEALVAIWGILKAGGSYIPIDTAYPAERIAFIVNDAAPALVLTSDDTTLSGVTLPETTRWLNLSMLEWDDRALSNPPVAAGLDDLAYTIYTSGSTGEPKGTLIAHRGLLNYVWWARQTYQQENEVLDFPLYSSLAFDLTITSIFVPLLSGGMIIVYGKDDVSPGLEILSVFEDDLVDIVKLTPAHLSLIRELRLGNSRVRKLIVGGEDFKTDLARSIHDLFGGNVAIYNEYGPTEAVVGCMIHQYDPQRDTAVSVPIGTPAANARIYLLDAYDQPVPPGVVGEMVISSDGVARGYHRRPELTAERFGVDPFRADARIYRSGDIARWNADGQMVFLGRRDHQVKISGARIELGEIEARLRAHQGIQDVVVSVVQFARHTADVQDMQCMRCGLPANYPGIIFNDEGVCDFCTDFDTFREDVFQYFKTMDDLQVIIDTAKAERQGDYDCMMLYSGGKDSTYVLSQLVDMGLKVLAFSLDNGYISDEAIENIKRITSHLGVDLVFGRTPHMNAIFADSLERHSNVCQGCYKTIYTLSMALARRKGIKYIFTGLSRGQLFETRLDELFRNRIFDVEQMDNAVLEARKVYHRVDDAVHQLLDVSMYRDDRIFEDVQFIDYFRYTDVELEDLYDFLSTRVPWIRPTDTGRSTNCLINEAGIYVHQTERGYHNYALPYSWDVRLGHKTREEAMEELDDDLRLPLVKKMLDEVGYTIRKTGAEQSEKRLAAYFTTADGVSVTAAELRTYLADALPAYMLPTYFVHMEALPLTPNGKVDQRALPNPTSERPDLAANYIAPETILQKQLAAIWSQTLNVGGMGIHDSFFDLGGASIPAVQIVARISARFDVPFPVSSFFEHPTIAEQAELLEEMLLDQLEALSDEEVTALLAEMDN